MPSFTGQETESQSACRGERGGGIPWHAVPTGRCALAERSVHLRGLPDLEAPIIDHGVDVSGIDGRLGAKADCEPKVGAGLDDGVVALHVQHLQGRTQGLRIPSGRRSLPPRAGGRSGVATQSQGPGMPVVASRDACSSRTPFHRLNEANIFTLDPTDPAADQRQLCSDSAGSSSVLERRLASATLPLGSVQSSHEMTPSTSVPISRTRAAEATRTNSASNRRVPHRRESTILSVDDVLESGEAHGGRDRRMQVHPALQIQVSDCCRPR